LTCIFAACSLNKLPLSQSLRPIFWTALVLRLLAAFFSRGYAFSDDHFEVIETARKWMDGIPSTQYGPIYTFSLLYPGLHVLVISTCETAGTLHPDTQMLFIRLVHALVSLLTVVYGYKLAEKIDRREWQIGPFCLSTAAITGWILALFWLFPFMSVRNLREFFCTPFLVMGFYHLYPASSEKSVSIRQIVYASFWFAIAFVVRYQVIFFPFGAGLVLLFQRSSWQKALVFGIGFFLSVALTQGLFDWLYWGHPLASLQAYYEYNAQHADDYPQGDWFMYLLTVGGLLLLPACFLFFIGFFYSCRSQLLLFLPALLFFIFHSAFPNKQERFILPFMPIVILMGITGYAAFYGHWQSRRWVRRMTRFFIGWFLVVNAIALPVMTFTYTKRSRVETMLWLYEQGDVRNVIFEGESEIPFPPVFYIGQHLAFFEIRADRPIEELTEEIRLGDKPAPNYIVFTGSNRLEQRIERIKTLYPRIELVQEVAPGFVDNIAFILNPRNNVNETWYIYKILP
jgi:hypothetical protein